MIPLPTHSAPPAPALRIVSVDGEQVAYAPAGPRYAYVDGCIFDRDQHRTLSLIEAERRLAKLDAETLRQPLRIGRILARDAVSLERAIKACRKPVETQRRATWPLNLLRRRPQA